MHSRPTPRVVVARPARADSAAEDTSTSAPATNGSRSQPAPSRREDRLHRTENVAGIHPGDRYIRLTRHPDFKRVAAGHLIPREGAGGPEKGLGRLMSK